MMTVDDDYDGGNDMQEDLFPNYQLQIDFLHNQHCFICRPSDSTVLTDAGIEPRTVATDVLAVRRSNH
jgi:hypothetical protein